MKSPSEMKTSNVAPEAILASLVHSKASRRVRAIGSVRGAGTPFSCAKLLCVCLLVAPYCSQADGVDDFAKRQMQRHGIPSLSLAVVKNGKLVKAKGYGLASVELNAPATKNTVYEIGSVTKVFTATAVMVLVNDGKLGLDDKITNHLSDLPQQWSGITVKHLLTHTSGITNDYAAETKYIGRRAPLSAKAMFTSVENSPLNSEPGEKFAYSNTGYYLLGQLIEKVGGDGYANFMQERIFTPLEMHSTRLNNREVIITNRAQGYALNRSGALRNNDYMDVSWAYSAGSLVSSVVDMAKWEAALYTAKLLPRARLAEMATPVRLNDGSTVDFVGLGWGINSKPRYGYGLSHIGQTPGFAAGIVRWTDERLTVIVLANKEEVPVWDIIDGVVRRYLPHLNTPIHDDDPGLTAKHKELLNATIADRLEAGLFGNDFRRTFFPKTAAQMQAQTKGLGAIKSFILVEQGANPQEHYTYRRYRALFGRESLRIYVELKPDAKIGDLRIAFD